MNQEYFATQMARLNETFGSNQYKQERLNLIWNEVRHMENTWLAETISYFISSMRQAPLVPEFRERVNKRREQIGFVERQKKEEETAGPNSLYSKEDIETICSQINERTNGRMTDDNFERFLKMITPPNEVDPVRCRRCEDTNVYFHPEFGGLFFCDHRR